MFIENVKAIAKHKGIKLGSVEHFIERPRGYFSRKPIVSLEDAITVSQMFGESLEDMISKDYSQIYKYEEMKQRREQLLKEIEELKKELKEMGGAYAD